MKKNTNRKNTTSIYNYAIVGSGPIGASTAFYLSKKKNLTTILITQDPMEEDPHHEATYLYAGGSVRWYWGDNEEKYKATKMTADFIKRLVKKGVDLSFIDDNYLLLHLGVFTPAINVSGQKLVSYLMSEAQNNGVEYKKNTVLESFKTYADYVELQTSSGIIKAKKVLLALGAANKKFMPQAKIGVEKRVLLVLDIKIDEFNLHFPHLILPYKKGFVYVFIKKMGDQYKMVLGQEDIIKHSDEYKEEDYLEELKQKGITKMMPFLKNAKTEKVLWGFDATNKLPELYTEDNKVFSVHCGSAVRSAIYIGETVSKELLSGRKS